MVISFIYVMYKINFYYVSNLFYYIASVYSISTQKPERKNRASCALLKDPKNYTHKKMNALPPLGNYSKFIL